MQLGARLTNGVVAVFAGDRRPPPVLSFMFPGTFRTARAGTVFGTFRTAVCAASQQASGEALEPFSLLSFSSFYFL